EDEDTDVVYEIVERNLSNVISDTPNFNMSPIDKNFNAETVQYDDNTANVDILEGRIKIYGNLSEKYFSDNSDIYVVFESEKGDEIVYEAFTISTGESLYGYSLYID